MSINLGEVFTAFIKKYDRKHILNYLGLIFFLCICCIILGLENQTGSILFLVIYIIASTIYVGYYAVTSHNEANNIENAFPPISELGYIIKEGVKYSFGSFLSAFIIYLIPTLMIIVAIFSCFINIFGKNSSSDSLIWAIPTIFLATILMLLLSYFVFLPLQIMYLKSSNFSDFFAFYKIKEFRKQKGDKFLIFFLFCILLNIVISIVSSSLVMITSIAGIIAKYASINFFTQILNLFITMVLYNLLYPNLIGQIAKYDVENEPKPEDYKSYYDDDEDDNSDECYNEDEDV